jgi:hypothetical protein
LHGGFAHEPSALGDNGVGRRARAQPRRRVRGSCRRNAVALRSPPWCDGGRTVGLIARPVARRTGLSGWGCGRLSWRLSECRSRSPMVVWLRERVGQCAHVITSGGSKTGWHRQFFQPGLGCRCTSPARSLSTVVAACG